MSGLAQIPIFCVLILVWVVLIVLSTRYVLSRTRARVALCGCVGVITSIVAFLAMQLDSRQTLLPSLQGSILFGFGIFLVSLLWTYLTPWIKGITWENLMADALEKSREKNKS